MKVEHATVYRLSATLDLTVRANGAITLQRSIREPLTLSPAETRNLTTALTSEGDAQ